MRITPTTCGSTPWTWVVTANYVSTRIQQVEGGTYRVTGELTINDVSQEVQMEASVEGSGVDP
jgi:polyisoprenoid-binding protein YceI